MTADEIALDELPQTRRVVVRHFFWRRGEPKLNIVKDLNASNITKGGEFRLETVAFQPLQAAV